jgi:transcriptional regulator with XRE-family HTH domain
MPQRKAPDPIAAKVGARIKELRHAQRLTQEKLAALADVSKGHLSGIEKGLVHARFGTLQNLAQHLEVELLDLVCFPKESPRQQLIALTLSYKPGTIRHLIKEGGR